MSQGCSLALWPLNSELKINVLTKKLIISREVIRKGRGGCRDGMQISK
jgi:hypothetical protein